MAAFVAAHKIFEGMYPMLHIAFCMEDGRQISTIKKVITAACHDVECSYFSFEYPMDLLDYINSARPEKCAVFFSTESLPTGLEIATKVNEVSPTYRFNLLCPTRPDDAELLFSSGVSYYIQHPDSVNLSRCIEFVKRFYDEQQNKSLLLTSKQGVDRIILSDIEYIMSDKRKVIIHMLGKEYSYYYKLDELEDMLGIGFLRCHQSFIVNMRQINKFVSDGLTLRDDTFIPVSRKRYFASKREYLSYITGGNIV